MAADTPQGSMDDDVRGTELTTAQAIGRRDMRVLADRRRFDWRTVFFGFIRSRRRGPRRSAEAEPLFADWHHPWLFFLSVGIMLFSCLDAFFTLQLIERGFIEVNPVMDAMIRRSTTLFAGTKVSMTAFGILVLVFLARARFMDRIRAGLVLTAFFAFYACLVCYEFVFLLTHL